MSHILGNNIWKICSLKSLSGKLSSSPSLHVASGFTLSDLENHFNVRIENFEAQSGTGEEGASVIGTRAIITNISSAPNPSAIPFTSDPANVEWKRNVKQDQKTTRRPSASVHALNALSEQITSSQSSMDSQFSTLNSTMTSGFESVVKVIKSTPAPSAQPSIGIPSSNPWEPILDGLAQILGYSKTTPSQSSTVTSHQTPVEEQVIPSVDPTPIQNQVTSLSKTLSSLSSQVSTLGLEMNERIDNLEQTTSTQITNLSTTYEQTV